MPSGYSIIFNIILEEIMKETKAFYLVLEIKRDTHESCDYYPIENEEILEIKSDELCRQLIEEGIIVDPYLTMEGYTKTEKLKEEHKENIFSFEDEDKYSAAKEITETILSGETRGLDWRAK